jgi:regulatory protein
LAIVRSLSNNRFDCRGAKLATRAGLRHHRAMSHDWSPDAGSLHQAALDYLTRYSATEAGLRRVLERRIERWARGQADAEEAVVLAARTAIEDVLRRLAAAGAVSDTAFAEGRARSLVRSGQSTRGIQMRLVAKGVAVDVARAVSANDADTELAAALVLARKRRIGPYRVAEDTGAAGRMKEMGVLARAGFTRDVASRVLETSLEEAEARIFELRR